LEHDVREHCNKRNSCQRTKSPQYDKHSILHQFEIQSSTWRYISVEFITNFPKSNGNRNIIVVVDQFTKMDDFMPMAKLESAVMARLFLENIWKYHRLPFDMMSNSSVGFSGHFITDLYQFLRTKQSMSTAFHPQTDVQTESLNQTIEHFLCTYCNYVQDNWGEMLAITEYVYNN
jgi:hypothetical protein